MLEETPPAGVPPLPLPKSHRPAPKLLAVSKVGDIIDRSAQYAPSAAEGGGARPQAAAPWIGSRPSEVARGSCPSDPPSPPSALKHTFIQPSKWGGCECCIVELSLHQCRARRETTPAVRSPISVENANV